MQVSRREMALLLPALAAVTAEAQKAPLTSRTYRFEDMTAKDNASARLRNVFDGMTHTGYHIDLHITELAPGNAPHASHHHEHEEMILIREGTMEVTIEGKTSRIGPGSVAFVGSNEEHGWRNVGDTRASYFVLALGRK